MKFRITREKSGQSRKTNSQFFYGYIVVIVSFIVMMMIWGVNHCYGIFFKPMITEFGWTRAATSGAFSLSMVMGGLGGIFLGYLNDRFGPRFVVTVVGLLAGAGFFLMSQVSAIWQLYLFYGVMIGVAIAVPTPLFSTIARWFVRRRTLMTGIVSSGIGIGAMFVPPLANYIITTYNWRVSYMILGIAIFIIVIFTAQFLRRNPGQENQAAYGADRTEKSGPTSLTTGFTLTQAVRSRQFWLILFQFFCFGFCLFTVMVHIVPHATDIGVSATSAANILVVIGAVSIIGKIAMGRVGDIIGNRHAFSIGFILMLLSLLSLLFIKDMRGFYLFAVIFGIAYGDMIAQQSPLVAAMFGLTAHGFIFGTLAVGLTFGNAAGPFVAGHIFDVSGSYQLAFIVGAIVSFIGLILTILLKPTTIKSGQ